MPDIYNNRIVTKIMAKGNTAKCPKTRGILDMSLVSQFEQSGTAVARVASGH